MNGKTYGLLAEFDSPETLLAATRAAREKGYRRIEAYTPFPVEGLAEETGMKRTVLPLLILIAGLTGAAGGFFLQYWVSAIAYPLNIGGRPYNSWPLFIPVMFELGVLCAALTAAIGMLALNGLPKPHHPLFHVERFEAVTRDGFFLCVEAADPRFDAAGTRKFLEGLKAKQLFEVPE